MNGWERQPQFAEIFLGIFYVVCVAFEELHFPSQVFLGFAQPSLTVETNQILQQFAPPLRHHRQGCAMISRISFLRCIFSSSRESLGSNEGTNSLAFSRPVGPRQPYLEPCFSTDLRLGKHRLENQ